MRPLEWLLCLCLLPVIFLMITGRQSSRPAFEVFTFLIVAVLVFHALFEGAHWQLGPVYLAAVVLVLSVATGLTMARWAISIAAGCIVLILAAGILSYLIPMFQLPKLTGEYRIGTRLLHVIDRSRTDDGEGSSDRSQSGRRELMAQAWYPAKPGWQRLAPYRRLKETNLRSSYQAVLRTHAYLEAPVEKSAAPFPLLIFSPAWTGQRTQSTFLMEELASHGFVVVSVDHTYYSGRVEFPDGRVFDARRAPEIGNFEGSTLQEQNARGDKYTLIEAKDQIVVLDALEAMNKDSSSPFFARLDMARVGTLGHSIGGAAAAEACYLDPRIKAALNLDGWVFSDVFHHGLSKPFLRMTGSPEIRPTPQEFASGPPSLAMYWQRNDEDEAAVAAMLRESGGYEFAIKGINHASFTDRPLYSPIDRWGNKQEVPPSRAYGIIDAYVVAFFSHYLRGSKEPLLEQNPSAYPEVQIGIWPAADGARPKL